MLRKEKLFKRVNLADKGFECQKFFLAPRPTESKFITIFIARRLDQEIIVDTPKGFKDNARLALRL